MRERKAFDSGMMAGLFLSLAAYAVNWLITPMTHPNASAFQRGAVLAQAIISLGIAAFLILRRRPRSSAPPAA